MVRSTTPSIDETTTLTGPWTKGKILGRGAVGTVFLAQLHDGRQAACKQIATEGLKGDDLKALLQERLEDAGSVETTAVSENDFLPGHDFLLDWGTITG